jgi:hypothetical protein
MNLLGVGFCAAECALQRTPLVECATVPVLIYVTPTIGRLLSGGVWTSLTGRRRSLIVLNFVFNAFRSRKLKDALWRSVSTRCLAKDVVVLPTQNPHGTQMTTCSSVSWIKVRWNNFAVISAATVEQLKAT